MIANTEWEKIKGEIAVAAALDWGVQPKNFHDLAHALAPVIERAMLAGQTIGINETAAHASTRRPIDGILPVLSP
jgi:hypothetical protein